MTDAQASPKLEQVPAVTTGLSALDAMLGGKGLPPGTIALLRGGPGTGKTTLSLQIIDYHLRQGGHAAFISLESQPDEVLTRAQHGFFPSLPTTDKPGFKRVNRTHFENAFFGNKADDVLRRDRLRDALALAWPEPADKSSLPFLMVIDSLSILVDILTERYSSAARTMVHTVCRAIQDLSDPSVDHGSQAQAIRPVVILTAERHPNECDPGSLVSESFLCDVEIQLTSERLPPSKEAKLHVEGNELRSFCRVTKSRSARNQRRRCCYDIVDGQGIVFYETYPGDGRILLFHENAPQETAVMDFFEKDVPQLFPTLQCEYFTRGTLHHVHDSQRRFRLIPENTDLCLASFDTYWINWYTEQWQRIRIWNIIKDELGSSEPVLTGFIHRLALRGRVEESCADLAGAPALANGQQADESRLKEILALAVHHIYKSDEGKQGIFELLSWERIRLFASRQSPIIEELARGTHRVLHDPEGREVSAKMRSVPYNLNVGFFVCRTDLLQRRLEAMGGKRGGFEVQMRSALRDVCRYRARWTAEALKDDIRAKAIEAVVEAEIKRIHAVAAWRSKQGEHLPSWTWEEIIACCQVAKCSLFIETPIFDTFLAVLLELLWAHGGQLKIAPDYEIEDWTRTKRALIQALSLLSYAFKQRIILSDWSRALDAKGDSAGEPPWLFARHWYSTLVDLLTAKDGSSGSVAWDPDGEARLCILPVPTTGTVACGKEGPRHISCAGEWHYAALKGSENTDLAYSLINWLVSSQQTVQEAFTSAVLPTAKSFYEIYGAAQCINVQQRTMDSLPKFTFNEARSLARNAGVRSSIFDYRRTMREIHGILEAIRAGRVEEPTQLATVLEDARDRIVKLGMMEPGIGKG